MTIGVTLLPSCGRDHRAGLGAEARRDRGGVGQRLFGGGRKRLLHLRLGILQPERGPADAVRARLVAGVDQRADEAQVGRDHLHGVAGCVADDHRGLAVRALL